MPGSQTTRQHHAALHPAASVLLYSVPFTYTQMQVAARGNTMQHYCIQQLFSAMYSVACTYTDASCSQRQHYAALHPAAFQCYVQCSMHIHRCKLQPEATLCSTHPACSCAPGLCSAAQQCCMHYCVHMQVAARGNTMPHGTQQLCPRGCTVLYNTHAHARLCKRPVMQSQMKMLNFAFHV